MSEKINFVVVDDKIVPNCEFSQEIDTTARFTKVFDSGKEMCWVYWEKLGNLPTDIGLGMVSKNVGVKLEEVFSPTPKSFYRLVKTDNRLHIQKLKQEN